MKIVVVVPAYNAGKTIENVFRRTPQEIVQRVDRFIVVNDGSSDSTDSAVEKLTREYNIEVIRHSKNVGYGAALKSGFKLALQRGADIIVQLHADGQYPPEMISELIRPIENCTADVSGGSRILYGNMIRQGMPLYKYIGNIALTTILNVSLQQKLSSYHSGFRAYSSKALRIIKFCGLSDYFDFDTQMLIHAVNYGLRIVEIPIPTSYGDEVSYLNPLKYGFCIIKIAFSALKSKWQM